MIFLPQPSSYRDTKDTLKLDNKENQQFSPVYLQNSTPKYTIPNIHGNSEDLGDIQEMLKQLQNFGFSVFAYDYRGYGRSQGIPRERYAYEDIDTAYN
jgi:alpha-beta hydrolase superfamily lysophospholipase